MRSVLFIVCFCAAVMLSASSAFSMDRWAALSMLESGNNDYAVGSHGEVSRYQIRPVLWPGGDPKDAESALTAAQKIMAERVSKFTQSHGRVPTDFEFYVLWNAPVQLGHPSSVVSERAIRFANLVQRENFAHR
jgi:hypothetical protein